MKCVSLFGAVAVLGLLGPWANADVQDEVVNTSRGLRVKVTGLNANQQVTGTNVNFNVQLEAFAPQSPQPPHYAGVFFQELHVKIGGQAVYDIVHAPGQQVPSTKAVRFASTHFDDGVSIAIRVDARLACYNWQGYPPQQVIAATIDCPVEFNVVAHNRVSIHATHEEAVGFSLVYKQTPVSGDYSYSAWHGALGAFDTLSSNKHSVQPSVRNTVNDLIEPTLTDQLKSDNVTFAFTHGTSAWFSASYSDGNPSNGDDILTWSEVQNVTRTTTTGRNLVLMYACETLDGGSSPPQAFGISGACRAYAGFDDAVYCAVDLGGESAMLSQHSNLVLTKLVALSTIAEALSDANYVYRPKNQSGVTVNLALAQGSDPYTRLFGVYAENGAKLNQWRNQWYCLP
ncbi:MAG: hypothetical protein KIS66_00995 [Fimbriimonadaceae bacterium]|nr:hypothetical protein [Fimbriimonadaceae bacterium]